MNNISTYFDDNKQALILNNSQGVSKILEPSNGYLQIDDNSLESGQLYIKTNTDNGNVYLCSTDGGTIQLKSDKQGKVNITSQNNKITVPIKNNNADFWFDQKDFDFSGADFGNNFEDNFNIDDISDLNDFGNFNVCGSGIGQYNTATGKWSW